MTDIKTPIRTPGGKSRAIKFLLPYVPNYKVYIEPFLGGGSMFLKLAKLNPNREYYINDIQYAVYAFWNILYNAPNEMIKYLLELKNKYSNEIDARELYNWCRQKIAEVDDKDEFNTACLWYVLNKTSFSGMARIGSYAPQAWTNNFTISCINKLSNVSSLMHSVKYLKISNLDYSKLLEYDRENTLFFHDPPYKIQHNLYGKNGDLHRQFDHKKFAEDIKQCIISKIMITYNDDSDIQQWFRDYFVIPWDLQYTMKAAKRDGIEGSEKTGKSGKQGKELLILNYLP